MTRAVFFRRGGRPAGFEISGHSGYAESGSDIVCAAVSAAAGIAECAVNDVVHAGAETLIDEEKALISLILPEKLSDEKMKICESVLEAVYIQLSEYAEQYPGHIQTAVKIIDGGK